MSAHYPLSPSASKRWLTCPGSVDLCRGKESPESSYAREGTIAHELAARMLLGEVVDPPMLCNRCNSLVASPPCQLCGSPEYRIDVEMIQTLRRTYVAFIESLRSSFDFLDEEVETKLESSVIEELGGTIDYKAIYRDGLLDRIYLHVADLKYGAGVPVEVEGNTQLLCYLLLASERHPNIRHFRLTVVQPRIGAGEPVTIEVTLEELQDLAERIKVAKTKADLAPGDHCRWCVAKPECPALRDQALAVSLATFGEHPAKAEASEEQLTQWLEMLDNRKAIEDYLQAIADRVLALIESGQPVPGWKAIRRYGHRAWSSDESEVLKLLLNRKGPDGKKLGKKQLTETKLKSVAQLDREGLGKLIVDLVCKSELGHKLAREEDKGEAIIFGKPEEMFSPVPSLDELLA